MSMLRQTQNGQTSFTDFLHTDVRRGCGENFHAYEKAQSLIVLEQGATWKDNGLYLNFKKHTHKGRFGVLSLIED